MRRLAFLVAWLWASVALAQAPSPAQIGITYGSPPATQPALLSVLDATRTFVPLGYVDPITHTFAPIGGGGGPGGGGAPPGGSLGDFQTNGGGGLFGSLPNPLPIANGGNGTDTPCLQAGANVMVSGCNTWPHQTISATGGGGGGGGSPPAGNIGDIQTNAGGGAFGNLPTPLDTTHGGTGTSSPCLQAGAGLQVDSCASWPNQTVTYVGGGGTGPGTSAGAAGAVQIANGSGGFVALPNEALSVQDPSVAMQSGTGATPYDNYPKVASLMSTVSAAANNAGMGVSIPPVRGSAQTQYYFSNSFVLNRQLAVNCNSSGPNNPVQLWFAAGVDGAVIDNTSGQSAAGSRFEGCSVNSLGQGTGNVTYTNGAFTSINAVTQGPTTGILAPTAAWTPGDGVIIVNGAAGDTYLTTTAIAPVGATSIQVSSTNLPTWLRASGQLLWDTTTAKSVSVIPPIVYGTTVSSWSTLGPTTTINLSQATVAQIPLGDKIAFANTNMLAVPEGASISACSPCTRTGAGLTLNATTGTVATPPPMPDLGTAKSVFWRLPANLAYTFTSTSGSNSITVTANPAATGARPLRIGDMIWAPGFPLGSTVMTVSGSTPPYTATINDFAMWVASNSTQTVTGGAMWVIPDGGRRRAQANITNITFSGFPLANHLPCPSTQPCNDSVDRANVYLNALIGRLDQGNAVGGSASIDDAADQNSLFDFAEMSGGNASTAQYAIGETFINMKSHSGYNGSAGARLFAPFVYDCTNNPNNSSAYGGFIAVFATPACAAPGPIANSTLLTMPPTSIYSDYNGSAGTCGQMYGNGCFPPNSTGGTFTFYSPQGGLPLGEANVVNAAGINYGQQVWYSGLNRWIYIGSVPGPCYSVNGSGVKGGFGLFGWNSDCNDTGTFDGWEWDDTIRTWNLLTGHKSQIVQGIVGSNEEQFAGYQVGLGQQLPFFPRGILLNNNGAWRGSTNASLAANRNADRMIDAGTTPFSNTFSTTTTVAAATATESALQLSACNYPAGFAGTPGLTAVDASVSTTPPLTAYLGGSAGQCVSTNTWVTLQAGATSASNWLWDQLLIGGSTSGVGGTNATANGSFGVGDTTFPLGSCTSATNGANIYDVTTATNVGVVASCAVLNNTLRFSAPLGRAVANGDTIEFFPRRIGDFRFNTAATAGAGSYVGWEDVASATPPYPAGQVAFDVNGIAWPAGGQTTIASLPTCPGTAPNVITGANAVITNGIAAPTYLQTVASGGTAGTSVRRLFCDPTGWLYD